MSFSRTATGSAPLRPKSPPSSPGRVRDASSMERTANVSANLSYVLQAGTLLVLLGFQWVGWKRRGPSDVAEEKLTDVPPVVTAPDD